MSSGVAETILRRDRIIVVSALAIIAALSWAYTLSLASDMQNNMDLTMEMARPQVQTWGTADFALAFVMWWVMMVAMMTPSAAPMILVFAAVNRRRQNQQVPYVPTSVFLVGYLLVWAAFSVVASVAQWGLHAVALLSPMMVSTSSPVLGGILLLIAGIYQWTPLKHACLSKCRSPLGFVLNEWREGKWGAFLMGIKHGGYCTGCCWSLMTLLFVAGAMNLLWVAAIGGVVLLEKLVPAGQRMGQAAGVLMVAGGVVLLGLALWVGIQPEMNPGTEPAPEMEPMPGMESM